MLNITKGSFIKCKDLEPYKMQLFFIINDKSKQRSISYKNHIPYYNKVCVHLGTVSPLSLYASTDVREYIINNVTPTDLFNYKGLT